MITRKNCIDHGLCVFFAVILIFSMWLFPDQYVLAEGDFAHIEGKGTQEEPFVIYTLCGLEKIGTKGYPLNAHYVLGRDIEAGPTKHSDYNYGRGWTPIGEVTNWREKEWQGFSGVFDGRGYKISDLYINIDYHNIQAVGLFRVIEDAGIIKNLTLENIDVKGRGPVGGLAAYNSGRIENITVNGSVKGIYDVGGLVGFSLKDGVIANSSSFVNVEGSTYIGGLIGRNASNVKSSFATGSIVGKEPEVIDLFEELIINGAGGLVGLSNGNIEQSYAAGDINGINQVGGLVGINNGLIENCYATGNVEGSSDVGGLVGNSRGLINKTYAVGRIRGVFRARDGLGILELKQEDTYRAYDYEEDWNFEEIWGIVEGHSYPYLRSISYTQQGLPGVKKPVGTLETARLSDPNQPAYTGPDLTGAGTEEDPFLIHTFSGLEKIGTKGYPLDGHYKLARDIDAGSSRNQDYNNGMGWEPIRDFNQAAKYLDIDDHEKKISDWTPFTGVFDGQGFQISNLFIHRVDRGCVGLFSALDQGGVIKSVNLVNVEIKGDSVGGLVGYNRGLTQDCTLSGVLESNNCLGGLVCINEGNIVRSHTHVSLESLRDVGGLVGINYGEVTACSSRGRVEASIYLGGLVGENYGIITESTSFADVVGDLDIGGLVGKNEGGEIIDCRAEGNVRGFYRYIGSLCGVNKDGNIVNSYGKDLRAATSENGEGIDEKRDQGQNECVGAQVNDNSDHILFRIELGVVHADLGLSPDGESIYVITDQSLLHAVNAEGMVEWSARVRWNYTNPVVDTDGKIYILDDQGVSSRLSALQEDGSDAWTLRVGNTSSNPVVGKDGTIYLITDCDGVIAVNPDGSKKWSFKLGETPLPLAVAEDGTLCVGDYSGLYGINPDGSQEWSWAYLHRCDKNLYTDPVFGADGLVYIAGDDKLYALLPDGSIKWIFKSAGRIYSKPAISKDGTIYFGSADGHLYALEHSGAEKWRIKFTGAIQGRPVLGEEGAVYIGTNNIHLNSEGGAKGNIYAIDPEGKVNWSIDTGPIISSGVISKAGILYYGSADGFLYGIGSPDSKLYASQHNIRNKLTKETKGKEERVRQQAGAKVDNHEAENAIHIIKKLYAIDEIGDLPQMTITGEEEFEVEINEHEENQVVHIFYQTDLERHKAIILSAAAGLPGTFLDQAERVYCEQSRKYGGDYLYFLEGSLLGGTLAQYAGLMSEGFLAYYVQSYNGIGLENLLQFRGNEFFGYKIGIEYYLEGDTRSQVILERLKDEGVIKDGNISNIYRTGESVREDRLKEVLVKVVSEEFNYTPEAAKKFVKESFDPIIVRNKMRLIERYRSYTVRHQSTGTIENYITSVCILARLLKNGVGKTYIIDDDLKMKDLGMDDEFRQYIEGLDKRQIDALQKMLLDVFSPFLLMEEGGNGELALDICSEKPTLYNLTNNLSMDYLRTLIKDIILDLQMKDEDFISELYEYSKMNQEVEVVRIITDRLKHSAKIQHKESMISDCEFTSDYFRENAHLFTDADKVYFWDQAVIEQFRKRMYLSEIYQLWDWEETEQGVFLILGTKGEDLIDYSIPGLDNIVDNSPIKLKVGGDSLK